MNTEPHTNYSVLNEPSASYLGEATCCSGDFNDGGCGYRESADVPVHHISVLDSMLDSNGSGRAESSTHAHILSHLVPF